MKEVGSGATQRKAQEKFIDAGRRRVIEVVLVWCLDRWGGSVTDSPAILQELEHLGVGFVSLTEALDLTMPAGRAMAELLAVFAEFKREILRDRVRASLAHARANGKRLAVPLRRLFNPIRSASCAVPVSANPKSPVKSTSAAPRRATSYHRRRTDLAMKTGLAPDIYQIKVTLLGTKPPIWRRLLVPASITLAKLHDVLQTAMGWFDCHMHEFHAGERRFGAPDPHDRGMGMPEVENEWNVKLSSVLSKPGAKLFYIYDFGDYWQHSLVLEKRLSLLPDVLSCPTCIDGRLACPPEDCGGLPGFYELLSALADTGHEQHEELSDWIDDDFDSQAFSVDLVNQKLIPKRRRSSGTTS